MLIVLLWLYLLCGNVAGVLAAIRLSDHITLAGMFVLWAGMLVLWLPLVLAWGVMRGVYWWNGW